MNGKKFGRNSLLAAAVLHCGRAGNMSFPFKWSLGYNVFPCGWQIGAPQTQLPFSLSPPPLIPVSYSHSLITTPLGTCPYCRQTLLCPILAKHWILQLQEIKFKPWLPPSQTEIQNPASSRSMQCVTLCHISFERCK